MSTSINIAFPLLTQKKKKRYDVKVIGEDHRHNNSKVACQEEEVYLVKQQQHQQHKLFFEQQLDQAFLWILCWDENQISSGILACVKNCSFKSKKFLSTILEPLLHRDFIYNKFDTNWDGDFACLSTFITREMRSKLEKDVNKSHKIRNKVYRLKSAYVKSETDVDNWSNNSILPSLKTIHADERESTRDILSMKSDSPDEVLLLTNRSSNINKRDPEITINQSMHDDTTLYESPSLQPGHFSKLEHPRSPSISRRINRLYMFQSPSRCTSLRRSKTQLHPTAKSAPAAIRLIKPTDASKTCNIFKSFPESLKTKKRYMQQQTPKTVAGGDNEDSKLYRASNFLPSLTKSNQQQKSMKYESEMSQVFSWFSLWTDCQQVQFLQNLLKLLTPTHLYFMYASIMICLYRDFISQLPETIALQILKYFKPKQLQACSKVCRRWKFLCTHDILWLDICKKKNITILKGSLSFMESYLDHKLVKTNWTEGKCRIKEAFHHNQSSVTCLDIIGDTIATGCVDKCIRIWKFDQKRHLNLEGHQRTIWSVLFISRNLLLSCSNDHTIKFWNIQTGKCIRTIVGHEGAVWCLDAKREIFVSGSSDRSAKVWQLRSCATLCSFDNHPGGVYSVALSDDEERLYTGSIDKSVRVWEISSSVLLTCLQVGNQNTPSAPVTSLSYDKEYLLCGCGTEMQLLDCQTFDWFEVLNEIHKEKVECVRLNIQAKCRGYDSMMALKGRMVTSGKDGKVKIWDLLRRKPVATLSLLEEPVNFLKFDDMKIVCACQDGFVRTIHFN